MFRLLEAKMDDLGLDGSGDDSSFESSPALQRLMDLVKDVGIAHTSLEEVFMKVTGKKETKVRDISPRKESAGLCQEDLDQL